MCTSVLHWSQDNTGSCWSSIIKSYIITCKLIYWGYSRTILHGKPTYWVSENVGDYDQIAYLYCISVCRHVLSLETCRTFFWQEGELSSGAYSYNAPNIGFRMPLSQLEYFQRNNIIDFISCGRTLRFYLKWTSFEKSVSKL